MCLNQSSDESGLPVKSGESDAGFRIRGRCEDSPAVGKREMRINEHYINPAETEKFGRPAFIDPSNFPPIKADMRQRFTLKRVEQKRSRVLGIYSLLHVHPKNLLRCFFPTPLSVFGKSGQREKKEQGNHQEATP